MLAGGWALVLGLGAWVGPGVVEGGSGTESVLDRMPGSATSAADQYITFSLDRNDQSRAVEIICDGYTPNLVPQDLRSIREEIQDGGPRPQVNPELVDEDENEALTSMSFEVGIVSDGRTETLDIHLSIFEENGEYCVAGADGASNFGEGDDITAETDARQVAIDFVSAIFSRNDIAGATSLLCSDFSGPTPNEVRSFHDEHASDPSSPGNRSYGDAESEGADEVIEVIIETPDGDVELPFAVTLDGDCIAEIADIPALEEMSADGGADESDSNDD